MLREFLSDDLRVLCKGVGKFDKEWKTSIGFGNWEVTGNLSKSIFSKMMEAKANCRVFIDRER